MDDFEARATTDGSRLGLAIILGAAMITLAILVTANEIRFQGCRSLANEQAIQKVTFQQACSRVPWGA